MVVLGACAHYRADNCRQKNFWKISSNKNIRFGVSKARYSAGITSGKKLFLRENLLGIQHTQSSCLFRTPFSPNLELDFTLSAQDTKAIDNLPQQPPRW